MDHVNSFNMFGTEVRQIPCMVGEGRPSENEGAKGDLYIDDNTGRVYKRTEKTGDPWEAIGGDFKWLGTLQGFDGTTKQAELDSMEGLGYVGEFSEFIIYMTLPTSEDILTNYKTQLYIGHEMYEGWECFLNQGYNREKTRHWRIHLRHSHEGWWVADGAYLDGDTITAYQTPTSTNVVGNLKSQKRVSGNTISKLYFLSQSNFPEGTWIEVYGK